jgi:biopolymer transport protein TolR
MNLRRKTIQPMTHLDMTPTIDVILTLLTFFMLTSAFIKTAAINVDLPSSSTSDIQPVREAVVTIYRTGEMTLNDQPITVSDLGIRVKELYIQDKDIVVTIRGDKGVSYGQLIESMDIVRLTGVKRLSLATTVKEEGNAAK